MGDNFRSGQLVWSIFADRMAFLPGRTWIVNGPWGSVSVLESRQSGPGLCDFPASSCLSSVLALELTTIQGALVLFIGR